MSYKKIKYNLTNKFKHFISLNLKAKLYDLLNFENKKSSKNGAYISILYFFSTFVEPDVGANFSFATSFTFFNSAFTGSINDFVGLSFPL